MRAVLQIAWREYRQYVFTRGFLLFLLIFPIGIVFGSFAADVSRAAASQRDVVVVDRTGRGFAAAIAREIAEEHAVETLYAWDAYARVALPEDAAEALPEPFAPPGEDARPGRARRFADAGGAEAANEAARSLRREGAPAFDPPRPRYRLVEPPAGIDAATPLPDVAEIVRPALSRGEGGALFAAVLIPEGFSADPDGPAAQYWSGNLTDGAFKGLVERALDKALEAEALAGLGVARAEIEAIRARSAPVTAFRADRARENAEIDLADRLETALPAGLAYLLFLIVFSVANILLTNTIEEKANKIVEVLLSSVTATQLMIGKLLGVAAVGLTMPVVFVGGGLAAVWFGLGAPEVVQELLAALAASNLLPVFFFYFLVGYVTLASIYLAVGAMSNSLQDAQSYLGVITIIAMAPIPFMAVVFQDPNGALATILSFIPLYAPYVLMLRAAAHPPLWEVAASTALLLLFAGFMLSTMGRIFRRSLLNTGAPPKLKDVARLLRG